MKALFVCERTPDTLSSGSQFYNYSVLKNFYENNVKVDLVITGDYFDKLVFSVENDLLKSVDSVNFVYAKKIGSRYYVHSYKCVLRFLKNWFKGFFKSKFFRSKKVLIGRFLSGWERDRALRLIGGETALEKYSLVLVDTIFRASVIDFFPKSVKKILICHDVFFKRSDSFRCRGYTVFPEVTDQTELSFWKKFTTVIAINPIEAKIIQSFDETMNVVTLYPTHQNYSDIDFLHAKKKLAVQEAVRKREIKILYIGSAAHHNVDGLNWFFDEVWPFVKEKRPDIQLDVVGSITQKIQRCPSGVVFLGKIPCLSGLRDSYCFAINPILMGSGLKIKILEYMALQLPVLTTTHGGYGYPKYQNQPYICIDDPDLFVRMLLEWVEHPHHIIERKKSCKNVIDLFSPERSATIIKDILSDKK